MTALGDGPRAWKRAWRRGRDRDVPRALRQAVGTSLPPGLCVLRSRCWAELVRPHADRRPCPRSIPQIVPWALKGRTRAFLSPFQGDAAWGSRGKYSTKRKYSEGDTSIRTEGLDCTAVISGARVPCFGRGWFSVLTLPVSACLF